MSDAKRKFKISGIGITDKQYDCLPNGRQIEYSKKIESFKARSKKLYISQKRKTHAAAWKEFKELYKPVEWYTVYHDGPTIRDDSFEVWFTA